MKQRKPKQQPFYVKRIRLRKSIIKTHQILQTISIFDSQPRKTLKVSPQEIKSDQEFIKKYKNMTIDKANLAEFDKYNNKSNKIMMEQMKNILKIYQNKQKKQTELGMNVIGLEVRRIIGDPNHKKVYQSPENTKGRIKSAKHRNIFNVPRKSMDFKYMDSDTISDTQMTQILMYSQQKTEKGTEQQRTIEKIQEKCKTACSPNRKNKVYLYQRMAGSQKHNRDETNYVYEKRIKSYTEFLWKCMLAHNIYLNLDLELPNLTYKKYKAFVGYGNNCNMIKGLIKRRFWWVISEENTNDCLFIWTQTKVNKIFERQESAKENVTQYQQTASIENIRSVRSTIIKKSSKQYSKLCSPKLSNQQFNLCYQSNLKLWNTEDHQILKQCFEKNSIKTRRIQALQSSKQKSKTYADKTIEIIKQYKKISIIQDLSQLDNSQDQVEGHFYRTKPIVHNHLPNNFYLGNKKALFYNLKEYYEKVNEDIFSYVPLTFHIKNGFFDTQYKRFIKFYQRRAKIIQQSEENSEDKPKKQKYRNIWIVKPGQNSNQGRGIIVIDQIYQLNTIIKSQLQSKSIQSQKQQNSQRRTFIVQLYIDRPFLYNDRKFDIRHYMLITNLYGVTRAYWYEQGYIRTSAYLFNINNFQPEIHLTNDAIQKHFPDYGRYEPYNKISYSQFQNYINCSEKKGNFNFRDQILPKMKKMATDAAKSVYTKISPKNQMNNFQIFGLDFMIDRNFKPWLIEINTNPCLDCTCPLLDRIIPYMVEQALKLSLDIVYPPPSHYPNSSRHYAPFINLQTFKYELIFDSLHEGEAVRKLYSKSSKNMCNYIDYVVADIGQIQQDQQFQDNGKEIKLEDFT